MDSGNATRRWPVVIAIVAVLAVVSLAISVTVILKNKPTSASTSGTSMFDSGGFDGCLLPVAGVTPSPSPPSSQTPVGVSADVKTERFEIQAPAKQEVAFGGQKARWRFVVVPLKLTYIGSLPNGSHTIPDRFQLIDSSGGVNCVSLGLTEKSNPSLFPYSDPKRIWQIPISLNEPVMLTLVFDLDPGLIQGAFLRAWDMGSFEWTDLSLGLT